MAEPTNNIWRGGVQNTAPESLEVVDATISKLLPGTVTDAKGAPLDEFTGTPYYIAQEQLYGSVDEETTGSARLLIPRSGDLFLARCVAGQTIKRDQPLAISADTAGYVSTVTAETEDDPATVASATLFAEVDVTGATVAGQLIPVRVK